MTFQLLKVGTDTEFFLQDVKTKKPVPVIGKFGGTKQNPLPIPELGEGFCIQEDNVMPEVNIPACADATSFMNNATKILNWLHKAAHERKCKVSISPSAFFTPDQLEHPQAKQIGCEPDYCVWTRKENEFDETKRELLNTLRSAGGHVHISFEHSRRAITEADRELLVMFCDLYLGVPSIILDTDQERRKLYGKAGSFRFKEYGIEYRTLSNFWFQRKNYMKWVFYGVQFAIEGMNHKSHIRSLLNDGYEIQEIINTQDSQRAYNMVNQWGLELPE